MPFAQVVCYGNPPRTRHNTTVSRLDQNRWAGLLDVTIDANSPVPISRQIFLHLRRAIVDQALPAGSAVPSSRELARRIGVSRTSIVSAYDELYAEGYIEGRRGSGTFVSNDLPPPLDAGSGMSSPGSPSTRRLSAAGIRYRDLSSGALTPPSMPFALGRCSVDARTADAWRRISLRHQRTIPGDALGYSDPFGRPSFRQVVSEYLKVFRAVQCQADQVMITSGAQQALDLSIKVLLDPGDAVWVEDPCYPATLRAVVAANLRPVPVPVDAEGLCVAAGLEREPAPRAIFLTPSHQYPTGAVMSMNRRIELLAAASRADAWIVEDDYDSEFRYTGRPLSSLHGLDKNARVIYIGTLSKVLFPAVRTGFAVIPSDLIPAFRGARYLMDRGPPIFYQQTIEDFMREGFFTSHVRRMRQRYRETRDQLVNHLRQSLAPHATVEPPDGGMHLIAGLPTSIDDRAVAEEALKRGVVVRPLSPLFIESPPRSGLDLGFTGFEMDELREATVRLGDALRTVAERRPSAQVSTRR